MLLCCGLNFVFGLKLIFKPYGGFKGTSRNATFFPENLSSRSTLRSILSSRTSSSSSSSSSSRSSSSSSSRSSSSSSSSSRSSSSSSSSPSPSLSPSPSSSSSSRTGENLIPRVFPFFNMAADRACRK